MCREGKREKREENDHQPKIGLALGAGGARGFAHIGVLKILEEHRIPIHYIAGSSIGALIGSLFSAGHSAVQLQKLVTHFPQKYWLDYTFSKLGLLEGAKIKEVIRLLTKQKRIEELPIPTAIVATNLNRGTRKIFTTGSIADAVRASISIPGIFVPEKINGEYYIDGGVTDRIPVTVVKEMGADIIIAVDVSHQAVVYPTTSIFDVIFQAIDIMGREVLKQQVVHTDVLLKPPVGQYSTTMFAKADEIIRLGEEYTRREIAQIMDCIQYWEGENRE